MQIKTTSRVLDIPAAPPGEANAYFAAKLACETDPSDVYADMREGVEGFTLLDVRSPLAYAEKHASGALSLPHQRIDAETMADWDRDQTYIVYCWGPGCNGADKAAFKLSALGFSVKTMIGGIEYWEREGCPLETSR